MILTSCASRSFRGKNNKVLTASQEGRKHYYFWALFQNTTISGEDACKQNEKVAAIDFYSSFSDTVLTYFTGGIYSPKSYAIFCQRGETSPRIAMTKADGKVKPNTKP